MREFPQFTTAIDGQDLHYLHVRSPEPGALPLILTHGWPGSVVDFMQIIGLLADPRARGEDPADAFHVVVPSVPGFGFSGPTRDTGWNLHRITKAFAVLMSRLGYQRYGARTHNIVHWSEFDRGGHFPAMEVPDLLVGDLREFFRRFR